MYGSCPCLQRSRHYEAVGRICPGESCKFCSYRKGWIMVCSLYGLLHSRRTSERLSKKNWKMVLLYLVLNSGPIDYENYRHDHSAVDAIYLMWKWKPTWSVKIIWIVKLKLHIPGIELGTSRSRDFPLYPLDHQHVLLTATWQGISKPKVCFILKNLLRWHSRLWFHFVIFLENAKSKSCWCVLWWNFNNGWILMNVVI